MANDTFNLAGKGVYRIAWAGLWDNAFLDSLTVNVPEPPSLALLGFGLLGLLVFPRAKNTLKQR